MISPFSLISAALIIFFSVVLIAPLFYRNQRLLIYSVFSLTTIASVLSLVAGIWTVQYGITESCIVLMGLPDLPFHLRLDPLSGFFLTMMGALGSIVSVYSIGYVKGFLGHRPVTSLSIFYSLFLAGMFMVVLADDAFFFLISWEVMAAASYFLVMFEDERTENRRAAFLYLVIAHIGAIAILLSFGLMAGFATGFESFNGYTFDAMRNASFPSGWAALVFFLAFFGFAAKAGVVPLHVWLPEAHPVAPSNVSALMSGIMLKTAIYGIIRVAFDLIRDFPWWWGAVVLILGLISALLGILFALQQQDLKKLLAYSSVENIGIILIGIGLSMTFSSFDLPVLSALALTAGLYHAINHAMFKGLLFMGAGAVLHATHERNMEGMGGLIHRMPWTSALFLTGCISISALPPFNGFVSEWLTFQAFLLSPALPGTLLKFLIPLGAALLALTAALAAMCFVKAFGVTFLGQWRGQHQQHVHEVDWFMKAGMAMTAIACLCLGIFPTAVIHWMDIIAGRFVGGELSESAGASGWMWLTPISHERASYSGPIVLSGLVGVVLIVFLLLHARRKTIHTGPLWDCGFEKVTTRMQYTSTAFSMPVRRIFGFYFHIRERREAKHIQEHKAFVKSIRYSLKTRDRFLGWLYQPVAGASFWIARKTGKLQKGRIQVYLIYSFATIILLLVLLR
ncbi:MAG: hydrogenase 4 subunit B [Nitrospirae bacterium]|nr:hydrogenase 4 subunit B [Nitrospirota bacterium]